MDYTLEQARAVFDAQKIRLTIGIPTYELMHIHAVDSLLRLQAHMMTKNAFGFSIVTGCRISENRNTVVRHAQENNSTHILWLDSDMVVPPNIFDRLLAHNLPIVGCNYSRRHEKQAGKSVGMPIVGDVIVSGDAALRAYAVVGFGALLTEMSIFDKMDKPYFAEPCYKDVAVGEDVYFCSNARDKGYTLWVDEELSKEIGHIGTKVFYLPKE